MSETNGVAADIAALGDKIAALTLVQAVELKEYLKTKYKIEPAAGGGMMVVPGGGGGGAAAEEKPAAKTEFTVVLESFDAAKKIGIIKAVREVLSGLGLKEAKDLVEGAPKPIKENVAKDEADAIKKKLEEAGAKISLK
ncbi:MAG TPA: 50S ribosomal protein L7/L12 [Gemmataceae bacterium]|nr:50S ribosomal protein L7/L12 [Gemmataceae bacterium]